jgi:uncharacterized membrane protein YgdD (TMEM256/DUF423 family)
LSSMFRFVLALAALNGLMAVAAGAFGAHAVAELQAKEWLRTGATYQLLHAGAALAALALAPRLRAGVVPAALLSAGGLLFGLSLYLLAATGQRMLGAVTPVGGVLMLLGWSLLVVQAARPSPPAG